METFIKIYTGSGQVGKRLKAAIKEKAKEKYFGSMARMMVYDFCEKYGYDPRTGKPTGCYTGAEKKEACHCDQPPKS